MAKRSGNTAKISVSVSHSDLASLRRRAKRLYAGNVSAVIAELAADAALLEGMQELVDHLGGPVLTSQDRHSLDHAWAKPARAAKSRPKAKSKKVS
ncbi:MAG: hypothetical protein IPM35_32315 [Myxococcales bacterium]|nr:hypothetical protein [Myxococcales bacterium]